MRTIGDKKVMANYAYWFRGVDRNRDLKRNYVIFGKFDAGTNSPDLFITPEDVNSSFMKLLNCIGTSELPIGDSVRLEEAFFHTGEVPSQSLSDWVTGLAMAVNGIGFDGYWYWDGVDLWGSQDEEDWASA